MRTRSILLSILSLATFAKLQPIQPVVVSGYSMLPTFDSMQMILTTRNFDTIKRGDVVIFNRAGDTMVKRVAYLPGDRFSVFFCNDTWIIPVDVTQERGFVRTNCPSRTMTVPKGHVFVVGDNSGDSTDSREFGPVAISNISSKALSSDGQGTILETARLTKVAYIKRGSTGGWS